MIQSYMAIALRNLTRHPGYTALNVGGLALGFVCCILLLQYVMYESSFDAFHMNADRLFRVTMTEYGESGELHSAQTYSPLGPLLEQDISGVQSVVRLLPWSVVVRTPAKELFQANDFIFADSSFFESFTFHSLNGSAESALRRPGTILLTENAARTYFGAIDVVGRELLVENIVLEVAAVIEDPPRTSSIQFGLIAPMSSARDIVGTWLFQAQQGWHWPPVYTYLTLSPTAEASSVESQFPGLIRKHLGDDFEPRREYSLQPITSIHTSADFQNEPIPTTSRTTLALFAVIAAIILSLASINYTNLATARSLTRAKEIGLRKISGAQRATLVGQFLGESIVTAFVSMIIATTLSESLLPWFNELAGTSVDGVLRLEPIPLTLIAVLTLVIGVAGGAYPAFILSSFQPVRALQGRVGAEGGPGRRWRVRSVLVLFQFVISIGLVISTFAMHEQIDYIRTKPLGFDKEQVLIVPLRDERVQEGFKTFKNSILSIPGVESTSALSNFPWERGFYGFPVTVSGKGTDYTADMPTLLVDEDFVRTMDMQIVSGRDFSSAFGSDIASAFIVNEEALRRYGMQDPVGLRVEMRAVSSGQPKRGEIIGVVRDFHFQSLHTKVEPLVMTVSPQSYYLDNLIVRVSGRSLPSTVEAIRKVWSTVVPDRPFEYFFMDQAFNALYHSEQRLARVFSAFSVVALVVGSLGLFGLASFSIRLRAKEIGIRRVLGASAGSIVSLLSREFANLVVIAASIAVPLGWYTMEAWLSQFAYRTSLGIPAVAASIGVALISVLMTVSTQAAKAALTNPVESLRNE